MQICEITCIKKRTEDDRVVLPFASVGNERKEREREREKRKKKKRKELDSRKELSEHILLRGR